MLTDEEIKSCILKTWKKMEVVTVPSFDVALETAIRFADALADEKAKPVPKSRTYDVGDVLRCRKAPGVEIRLEELTGVGSWWALPKGGANRCEARIVTRQELDTDYERVPTEKAKPAPAPERKPWPKLNDGEWKPGYCSCCGLPDDEDAIALALNEFPAAVALLRRFGAGTPPWTDLETFLASVDAAGFDL